MAAYKRSGSNEELESAFDLKALQRDYEAGSKLSMVPKAMTKQPNS